MNKMLVSSSPLYSSCLVNMGTRSMYGDSGSGRVGINGDIHVSKTCGSSSSPRIPFLSNSLNLGPSLPFHIPPLDSVPGGKVLFHPNLLTPKAAVRWADILCLASPPRPLTPLNISPIETGVIASDQTVPLLTSSEDYPPISMAEKGKGIDCSITGPIQPSIRQNKKYVRYCLRPPFYIIEKRCGY